MDNIAGSAALLEGVEIVNNARTVTYLKAGYGPPNINVTGDCDCPEDWVRELLGCDEEPYLNPISDEAPWFDPNLPESGDFAGFYAEEFEGIDSTYTREVFESIDGGAILGRLRAQPRTLTWKGYLFGRTCCATAYGLRWLTSVLRQSRCGTECTGEKLDILMCCPPVLDDNICVDNCVCSLHNLPPPSFPGPFGESATPENVFRSLYNVGLLEGPKILSERKSGCGCGCAAIMEIEFSLVAGNPHLWREPIILANCLEFPPGEKFFQVPEGEECPTPSFADGLFVELAPGAVCPPSPECESPPSCFVNDPVIACRPPLLPIITTLVDPCVCDPYWAVESIVTVPSYILGSNFLGVPIFQVYSGAVPLRSTAIKIVENPLNHDCGAVVGIPCSYCNLIRVRWIPAYSRLIIDGVNQRTTIECPGGGIFAGEPYIVGPFTYPTLECMEYCVSVTIDGATAAADACFSMFIVPKEM